MIIPLHKDNADLGFDPANSNLIAVASGKGGVGKTWFSITLSHALSLAGKRPLLFDGDLGLANIDVQLGITPDHDLSAFLSGQSALADTTTRYDAGGFDIIVGRSGSGSLAQVAPSRLAALRADLQNIGNQYDYVIMDMGAGIDRVVRSFTTQARTCFVVTNDEPTALTDAYALIKVTLTERPATDIRIIVNQAGSKREGEKTYGILRKACIEFLKIEPALGGIIRRDPHVRESIRKQSSILTRFPNSDAVEDIQIVADSLMASF